MTRCQLVVAVAAAAAVVAVAAAVAAVVVGVVAVVVGLAVVAVQHLLVVVAVLPLLQAVRRRAAVPRRKRRSGGIRRNGEAGKRQEGGTRHRPATAVGMLARCGSLVRATLRQRSRPSEVARGWVAVVLVALATCTPTAATVIVYYIRPSVRARVPAYLTYVRLCHCDLSVRVRTEVRRVSNWEPLHDHIDLHTLTPIH